jgi:DNA uptake protein ComE-like DNA-binding protein
MKALQWMAADDVNTSTTATIDDLYQYMDLSGTGPFLSNDEPAMTVQHGPEQEGPLPLLMPVSVGPPSVELLSASRVVDINTADILEISEKLNLDRRRARIIVEYRRVHGEFKVPDDFAAVYGLTSEQVSFWDEQNLLRFAH